MNAAAPTSLHAWAAAARPKTLGAIIGPCAIGAGIAFRDGTFDEVGLGVAILGGLSIQLLTNLVNDLVDGVRGTDSHGRLGPARAVSSGWISPRPVVIACLALAIIAVACAFFLAHHRSTWFAPLALLSIALALAYSAGPVPLSYSGAADPFALLFFGPVACAATVAAQSGNWDNEGWWLGLGPGGLAVVLLAINNVRDAASDAMSGKRTLAVRFGTWCGRMEVVAGLVLAGWVAVEAALGGSHVAWLAVLVIVLLGRTAWRIVAGLSGSPLNRELHLVGAGAAAYGLAMAIAVAVGGGGS